MHDDGYFDAQVAITYDADHGDTDPEIIEQTISTLRQLAGEGEVLEFAIGTGRIALPLHRIGVVVKGIELSRAMVEELRKKENGTAVEVTIGDMTSATVQGDFSLVFLVFNTIDNLTTQQAQIDCFVNASAHLKAGGRFLIETQIPPIQQLPFGETKRAFACSPEHWGVDEYDIATQQYRSHHIWRKDGEYTQLTVPFRYAWPSELDLMAKMAGLELEYRWADWQRARFTNLSASHISVWRKVPD